MELCPAIRANVKASQPASARYDEFRHPDDRTYRRTGRTDNKGNELDTPEIHFSEAPRTNILATSSDAWFFEHLHAGLSPAG